MKIKAGVNYAGLSPQMKNACGIIDTVYVEFDYICVLTSGNDGVHGNGSLHYEGEAGDFRTRQVTEENKPLIAAECRRRLGADFEVILEATHMHVEHDPHHNRRVTA